MSMKLKSKITKIILIILAVAVLIPCCYFGGRVAYAHITARQRFVQFEACAEDLHILVDFLEMKYGKPEHRPDFLTVANGRNLYDRRIGYITSADMSYSIRNISEGGFPDEDNYWNLIRFDGTRIQFETVNGDYALVYSPDGEPQYLHSEDENIRILVEHIEGSWYHVSKLY